MEYKMKKSMALGVVIMLCAVAMVGAGYAAFNGNARTYNAGNSADAGFMNIVPDGSGAAQWTALSANVDTAFNEYTYQVMVDEDNDAGTPDVSVTRKAYYFDSTSGLDTDSSKAPVEGYTIKILGGKDYIVSNKTNDAITAIDFEITADKIVGNADFIYLVKVKTGTSYEYLVLDSDDTNNVLHFTGLSLAASTGTATFTVSFCIAYLADAFIPESFIGPAADSTGTGYTQGAKVSDDGPVSISTGASALSLGFKVTDATS